jgi:hypothetical protein
MKVNTTDRGLLLDMDPAADDAQKKCTQATLLLTMKIASTPK